MSKSNTLLVISLFIMSMFAPFVQPLEPPVLGIGEITHLEIDGFVSDIDQGIISVDEEKEIIFKLHNDYVGAESHCIDEIIIKFPDSWQGSIDPDYVQVTNMNNVNITNEADDGSYTGLVDDGLAIRIIPDTSTNGVQLCPSATTKITIEDGSGLMAPADPEVSEIIVMTSDQYANEPSGSFVRQEIDDNPIIQVTGAITAEIQYLDLESFVAGAGGADYKMVAVAKGGWGRLTELYLRSSTGTDVDIYMDRNGNGVLETGTDYLIVDGESVGTDTTTVELNDYSGVDITGLVDDGYLIDWEQDVSAEVAFFIEVDSGTLELLGHADEDADGSIDPTYKGTGFSNPIKEGTVINVEDSMRRSIHVQLVAEDADGRSLYIRESGVPIYYTTTLSNFLDSSPRSTDSDGQVEIFLLPGIVAGNALVTVTFPDVSDTEEEVAIAPGAAYDFSVTPDTSVEAGSELTIQATIYDQYGNVISNNPDRPEVSFEITSAPAGDADLDDDTNPPFDGDGDGFESENSDLGIGDATLLTSESVGDNVVEVCVENLGCKTVTIEGTLGQAHHMECTLLDANMDPLGPQIAADDCFNILVQVEDMNGNPLPKWESLVKVSLDELDASPLGAKAISGTNLREEADYMTWVQGKLLPPDPDHDYAWAVVEVCGCEALGTFNVTCESDTLADDEEEIDVINSEASCVEVVPQGFGPCSTTGTLQTSILDTCRNKLVDQTCGTGGATSCIALSADCGTLSTDKTCVDIYNTGMAPAVDLDITGCGCGDIGITAIDEDDCCDSAYPDPLGMCEPVFINKQGPYDYMTMDVYPEATNQDDFYVSERTVVEFMRFDECDQLMTCDTDTIDVELVGEDCVDTSIQVDSPLSISAPGDFTNEGSPDCIVEEDTPLYKIVVENCKAADKSGVPGKEWTDIPEKDDIIVDKFAVIYDGPTTGVEICIYEESEDTAGFQSYEDHLWTCAELDQVPAVPADGATPEFAAWDSVHDGAQDGSSDIYLLELGDRISKMWLSEYDNQRMGGALIEPGDTKDFYFVLSGGASGCGTYDLDYLYMQDYNSPDWIEWDDGGMVRDTIEDSERYTRRNLNYDSLADSPDDQTPEPYPKYYSTPDYGFGDRMLENLGFVNGVARAVFRDLVAEEVDIIADGMSETVTFLPQPATQVVALNHGDTDEAICDGDDVLGLPYPWENTLLCPAGLGSCPIDYGCRPAQACSDEGYDVNLQLTDGFQNQVGLEGIKVQLEACMLYPRMVKIDDGVDTVSVDMWNHIGVDPSNPWDACFDMAKFRQGLMDAMDSKLGTSDYLLTMFLEGSEFSHFVEEMFEDKHVIFLKDDGTPADLDEHGHPVVYTDADGRAVFRVESDDSSVFGMRSFDTRYRVFTIPYALDADYFDVEFSPGDPYEYDIMAWPESGIPADGEQESMLLIRKLDSCGNPVMVQDEVVTVSVNGSAIISRDFAGNNNYDQDVTGSFQGCDKFWPWLEDCSLTVLSDVPETVSVTVQDTSTDCRAGQCINAFGTGFDCSQFDEDEMGCVIAEVCEYIPAESDICNNPDMATVEFVGAPRHLKIVEIKHSDLLPADGFLWPGNDPALDACTYDQLRKCSLLDEPEICFQTCKKYGGSGAWVTVEVQDKYGKKVSGYLGDGLAHDPGDQLGLPDYVFEDICVAFDDPRAFIDDWAFGWTDWHQVSMGAMTPRVYCGDVAYGVGAYHVSYATFDKYGQPMDPRETASVAMTVFDKCDATGIFPTALVKQIFPNWDDECNAQEYNENNLPDSETASRLTPDYGQIDYVAVPDRWDMHVDKLIVAADGKDYATVTINPENEYFETRSSMEAVVQSSLLGTVLESEYIHPECYVEGFKDPLNPTSIVVNTEACSGGKAKIKLSSTEPGITTLTVTGNGYGCTMWNDYDMIPIDVYEPECLQWGVIPLTPKTIQVEFKQAYDDEINLETGWNFFSIPYELDPSADQWSELGLNTACTASAMWDESSQAWVTPVPGGTELEPLEGYWCHADVPATIQLMQLDTSGGVYLPLVKQVYAGWNDVGLASSVEMKIEHALISIDSLYKQVLDWIEGMQKYTFFANTGVPGGSNEPGTTGTSNMLPGEAYFIWSSDEGNLPGQS